MTDRVVLLASARTYRNDAFAAAAHTLGLEVVFGLDVPPPMLPKMQHCLALDYRDPDRALKALLRFAKSNRPRALLGVDDFGTVLAARASAALGLPHNAPEAAEAASDKAHMRRRFAAAGVPSPVFHVAHISDEPQAVLNIVAERIGFPCVLKPTRLSASKGVMRADDPQEFLHYHARLHSILDKTGCEEWIVESFIPGVEVALEGLLDHGQLHVLALFDKPDPLDGPFFEETIYVTPSRLPAKVQTAIARTTEHACAALGLREGPVHAELRLTPGFAGGEVVEVAARSIGGLCSQVLKFAEREDQSLEELILRQACGLPFDAQREPRAGGVMMIPIPAAGLLRAINGVAEAERVPLIEKVEVTAPLNYPLAPLPEGDSYLGFIFARGETPAAVEDALRAAHAHLQFDIEPEIVLATK
jgi:biotin carboxylase